MPELFTLDGHNPVQCRDLMAWAQWFETADRTVAKTEIAPGITVSTVFLAINHRFRAGPPVLFETMIFTDYGAADMQDRYCTWAEAEAGHSYHVAEAIARLTPTPTPAPFPK